MAEICLYFQVHQPFRILDYSFFQIGKSHIYENTELNKSVLARISENCYLKANKILLDKISKHKDKFKVTFGISGTVLEQLELYFPDVLDSFKALARTGQVHFLGETYYHSLSFIYSRDEFKYQVEKHVEAIERHFHQKPAVFRNSELIYSNELAKYVEQMGFEGILSEGVERILKGRSPDHVYQAEHSKIKCLLRNCRLSDDLSLRFSDSSWDHYPITAKKFKGWLDLLAANGSECINLWMNYETFGEHQTEESGIFQFLDDFIELVAATEQLKFSFPTDILRNHAIFDTYKVQEHISWANSEKDISAWLSNSLQYETLHKIYELAPAIVESGNEELLETWRKLQTSDHFFYMCTKYWHDGNVHQYFSPYNSPYDAYVYYMNILSDIELRLKKNQH